MSPALVLWFTGLSGSGKSTVAIRVKRLLEAAGQRVEVIDGDEMRRQHQPPLGYTRADIEKTTP